MKANYINELAEGMKVDDPFAVRAKEMRAARSGDAFLSLELVDRTGQLPAVYFRPDPAASAIPVGSVVRVRGTVTSFRGQKRISVETMRAEQAVDPDDFIAGGTRSRDELVAEFKSLAAAVRDPQLRKVLRAVFGDAEFFARFALLPGLSVLPSRPHQRPHRAHRVCGRHVPHPRRAVRTGRRGPAAVRGAAARHRKVR